MSSRQRHPGLHENLSRALPGVRACPGTGSREEAADALSSLVLPVLEQCLSSVLRSFLAGSPGPSLSVPGHSPLDEQGLTRCLRDPGVFPTGVIDASKQDQTVPQLKGWEPWGALGTGFLILWCPTGCLWDKQFSSTGVARGLCSWGFFSSGCGARWSLELTGICGICGPSCAPQGPVGQGQAVQGPS